MGRLDKKNGGAFSSANATRVWQTIAGPLVLSHTTGAHLSGDVLIIYVDSPVWATELSAMAERYRTSMNQEMGQETVRTVRFTVSKRVSDEHRLIQADEDLDDFYHEDVVDHIELTPTERAQVEASAAVIPDDQLREAVVRATVKDLEWKRGIAHRNSRERPRESF